MKINWTVLYEFFLISRCQFFDKYEVIAENNYTIHLFVFYKISNFVLFNTNIYFFLIFFFFYSHTRFLNELFLGNVISKQVSAHLFAHSYMATNISNSVYQVFLSDTNHLLIAVWFQITNNS